MTAFLCQAAADVKIPGCQEYPTNFFLKLIVCCSKMLFSNHRVMFGP